MTPRAAGVTSSCVSYSSCLPYLPRQKTKFVLVPWAPAAEGGGVPACQDLWERIKISYTFSLGWEVRQVSPCPQGARRELLGEHFGKLPGMGTWEHVEVWALPCVPTAPGTSVSIFCSIITFESSKDSREEGPPWSWQLQGNWWESEFCFLPFVMITGGGSKQQELFFLTLKKKVLHFASHFIPSVDIYQQ